MHIRIEYSHENLTKVRKTNQQRVIKKWCLCVPYNVEELFHLKVHSDAQLLSFMNNTKQKALNFFKDLSNLTYTYPKAQKDSHKIFEYDSFKRGKFKV
jgi:hypothetical protein